MKIFNTIPSVILIALLSAGLALAQRNASLTQNAALRYWSAFSAIQDSGITDQQAKELNAILDGTAPYDDSKYKELLEKNKLALEIMARATSLPNCDWGASITSSGTTCRWTMPERDWFSDGSMFFTPFTCLRPVIKMERFALWQPVCGFRRMSGMVDPFLRR